MVANGDRALFSSDGDYRIGCSDNCTTQDFLKMLNYVLEMEYAISLEGIFKTHI